MKKFCYEEPLVLVEVCAVEKGFSGSDEEYQQNPDMGYDGGVDEF